MIFFSHVVFALHDPPSVPAPAALAWPVRARRDGSRQPRPLASRRLIPYCAFGVGKDFALLTTAPEKPLQRWEVWCKFLCGWECKARCAFYGTMSRSLCAKKNWHKGVPQPEFLGKRRLSVQPAPHLQLERVGKFARRAAEPEKASCFLWPERCSWLRMISCVDDRMAGFVGRVSRVCAPPLQGGLRGVRSCRRDL